MTLAIIAIVAGFAVLLWSAERFVEGAAVTARNTGVSPLMIGMVITGFGSSAPEMVVAAFASLQGNPGLALGNAYGSNITNIALILGLTALIKPIDVHSKVLRKELPILAAVTVFGVALISDGYLSRLDSLVLFLVLGVLFGWIIWSGLKERGDSLDAEVERELDAHRMPTKQAVVMLVQGLVLLIVSSRVLVWGAVEVAVVFGISDLIIGLTIVALGTSLPELAASVIAIKKGEHDIAIGNVLGSNLFNTLAVVGIAGVIHPMEIAPEVLWRDCLVMGALTFSLFAICYGFRGPGRINRFEGAALLAVYIGYTGWLASIALDAVK